MAKNTNKKLHTKVGDRVIVVSGKDKGKEGNVKDVNPAKGTVLVDGVNVVTKAQKANPMAGVQGGLNKVAKPLKCILSLNLFVRYFVKGASIKKLVNIITPKDTNVPRAF